MGGLRRGTPENPPVDEKIADGLRYLANDRMKMNTDQPWETLPGSERNRSSTYVGTNVSEFTPEQQAAIKKAIMDAADKATLPGGNTVRSVDDVKFLKGKNCTVIEVQGQPTMDVDLGKLRKILAGEQEKFKEVKISGQGPARAQSMEGAIADAAKGYNQAMQEMNADKNQERIAQSGQNPPPPPETGRGR